LAKNEKEKLFSKLTPLARDNKLAAAMEYTFNIDKIAGIGKMAPGFTQNDFALTQIIVPALYLFKI